MSSYLLEGIFRRSDLNIATETIATWLRTFDLDALLPDHKHTEIAR